MLFLAKEKTNKQTKSSVEQQMKFGSFIQSEMYARPKMCQLFYVLRKLKDVVSFLKSL